VKLRISIRYKVMLTILALLLAAIATFLYLATTLFNADKLVYIYDRNTSLVQTLSDQTRSELVVLVKQLSLFGRSVLRAGDDPPARLAAAKDVFSDSNDVVHAVIYRRAHGNGTFAKDFEYFERKRLEELAISSDDLDRNALERPLPMAMLVAAPGQVFVQNSSLPPDAALLTLAVSLPSDQLDLVVACDVTPERLLRIFTASTINRSFLIDGQGVALIHPDPSKVLERASLTSDGLVRAALESKVASGSRELQLDNGEVVLGAYAQLGIGRLVALTEIPRQQALAASRELLKRSGLFAAAIFFAALVASVFFSRALTARLRKLRAATETLSSGRFDVNVDVRGRDEIGDLARAFSEMAKALKQAQVQLVRSEKLAAFGQLGAGITHEVKNPMTGILGFAQIAQQKLDDKPKLKELLQLIETETKRCRDILVNFLKFARQGSVEFAALDVNQVVSETAKIVNHQLMIHKVRLQIDLGQDVPQVHGNLQELQQVVFNLAINAQQAMADGGQVKISTTRSNGEAVIEVADDGPGIPDEVQKHLFEPFFTTKPPGEGTGLGLSICYGIVRDHRGTIAVHSTVGKGTIFTVRLPAQQ